MGVRPTHRLKLQNKSDKNNVNSNVGVLWLNPKNNYISIALNPGIFLTADLLEQYWLSAYPIDEAGADEDGVIPF